MTALNMPQGEFVITNAQIITCDEEERVFSQGDIHVKDGKIVGVGPQLPVPPGAKIFDATGYLAIPGLINAHTHAAMTLFRGFKDDVDLWEWLQEHIWPAEAKLEAEDVYWGTLLACIEMLKAGVTTFVDMYFFMEQVAEAVAEAGMRAYLAWGITDGTDGGAKGLAETEELLARWEDGAEGRIKILLGPHAPYTCSRKLLERVRDFALAQGVPVHIHLSETRQEVLDSQRERGVTPVQWLREVGLLHPEIQLIAAHCAHLTPEDIQLCKEHAVGVVHCLGSNLKLASGVAPVPELLEAGVKVSLGTDGAASNNNLDVLREMRLVALVHDGIQGKPGLVPASKVLAMATGMGALVLGRPDLGRLKVGARADIVLLNNTGAHWYPKGDLVSALIYSGNSADVDTVIIDGRFVVSKGKVLTIDEEEVKQEVEKRAWRLRAKTKD